MAHRGNGWYSPEQPEYRADALHHHQANARYSAVCASGSTYERWVASPSQLQRYRRTVAEQNPTRCEWPTGPCVAGCTARHLDADAQIARDEQAA